MSFWVGRASQKLTDIVRFNFHTLHRKQKISASWCFHNLDPPRKLLQSGLACLFLCFSVLWKQETDCSQACFPLHLKCLLGQSLVFCTPRKGSTRARRVPPEKGEQRLSGFQRVRHLGPLLADLFLALVLLCWTSQMVLKPYNIWDVKWFVLTWLSHASHDHLFRSFSVHL